MKRNKAVAIIAVIFFIGAVAAYVLTKGPDPRQYEFLKNPRITKLADQKMIEVRATGDPTTVGKDAFGLLFKTFYQLKRSNTMENAAPRTRWPKSFNTPRNEWVGLYALPIPASVLTLPEQNKKEGLTISLATWEYGDVAEILHVGSYATETPTIEKLYSFIKQQGYEIAGAHEEEYLKGPGMFLQGDPDKYYTIIRYQVKRSVK
jgi:hypothetical protein